MQVSNFTLLSDSSSLSLWALLAAHGPALGGVAALGGAAALGMLRIISNTQPKWWDRSFWQFLVSIIHSTCYWSAISCWMTASISSFRLWSQIKFKYGRGKRCPYLPGFYNLIWGFPYMWVPQNGFPHGTSIYKWMIWGYPYFKKPPYPQIMAILSFCVHCWLQATMLRALVFQQKAWLGQHACKSILIMEVSWNKGYPKMDGL